MSTLLTLCVHVMLATSAQGQLETCWTIDVVDEVPGVGYDSSVAYGQDELPAIAYHSLGSGSVRFAEYDGAVWHVETIGPTELAGATVLAYDPGGEPAVAYFEQGAQEIRYTRRVADEWVAEIVAVSLGTTDVGDIGLAFDLEGSPAISFRRGDQVWIAEHDGIDWTETFIASGPSFTGLFSSVAFGADGSVTLVYNVGFDNLNVARRDGNGWTPDGTLDTGGGVSNFGLAYGPTGQPAVAYANPANAELRYAQRTLAGSWDIQTVDVGGSFMGGQAHMTYDASGRPLISYTGSFDEPSDLRLATQDQGVWSIEVIDVVSEVVLETTVAVSPGGARAISYGSGDYVATGVLKVALSGAASDDCNGNTIEDTCDIAGGTSQDCNGNAVPDECDLTDGSSQDCNQNDIPDDCDLSPQNLGEFADSWDFPAGAVPFGLALGDLNGDGTLDLATTNFSANGVSILFNQGVDEAGDWIGFTEPATFDVGSFPVSAVVADLDDDGDMDLVTANSSSDDVTVLFNDGTGAYATGSTHSVGLSPQSVLAVDLDGDGDPDLAVVNEDSDDVSILFNQGDGTFGAAFHTAVGDGPEDIAAGDFDIDGDLDLAIVNGISNTAVVLINDGHGAFKAGSEIEVGNAPASIIAHDLDDDGDVDLATANRGSNTASVLLNTGDGSFMTVYEIPVGLAPRSMQACDLDTDGDVDLAIANFDSGRLSVLLNDGDAAFVSAGELDVGAFPSDVAIGDIDSDGFGDLIASSGGVVNVLLNGAAPAISGDCNANAVPDECDITDGSSQDSDGDGVPDECLACDGDLNGDDLVDPLDVGFVLARFGCPVGNGDPNCDAADTNGDGLVDPLDAGYVLSRFGECP